MQKKVRELEAKVEELEEDLENEQNNKSRVSHSHFKQQIMAIPI